MVGTDVRAKRKLAFIVERYGAHESSEASRRTRSMAAAMAARGHDVTVLASCSYSAGSWRNELDEGDSELDGVRVVRFRIARDRTAYGARALQALLKVRPATARYWARAHGPVCPAYVPYLERFGALFEALFVCGEWGWMALHALGRWPHVVLAPAPASDATRRLPHARNLVFQAAAIAVATADERDLLATEVGMELPPKVIITGACTEPYSGDDPLLLPPPVSGPFLVCVGLPSPRIDQLVRDFCRFRDTHADAAFEDDQGRRMTASELRLVLAGAAGHGNDPNAGVVGYGPVDDQMRRRLLAYALATVHADASVRIPAGVLEAWSMGRPTLTSAGSAPFPCVFDGGAYSFESPETFGTCLASLLASRIKRYAFARRAQQYARSTYQAARVAEALEKCVQGVQAWRNPTTVFA